jgi:hypothetical protein
MKIMEHPDHTCLVDRVVYYDKNGDAHVAFVTAVNSDDHHVADLVFYCTETHAWHEAKSVQFSGTSESSLEYFTNPEA